MDVLECALHRQWLREKGFTTVVEGKTYRTDKDLKALNAEFGKVAPPAPPPTKLGRMIDPDLRSPKAMEPQAGRNQTKAPRLKPKKSVPEKRDCQPKQPKPKVARQPKPIKPKPEKLVTGLYRCCEIIRSLDFQHVNALELILAQSNIKFDIKVVDRAARMTDGVSVYRIRGNSFLHYDNKTKVD